MSAGAGVIALILGTFSFHVVMLGIEVVLSLVIIGLLVWHKKTGNDFLKKEARQFMFYISMTYASAHFFLTATTIFTLSFYPEFMVFLGQALTYPLLWVLNMILLRLGTLAIFWYGWDNFFGKPIHYIAGIVYALAGLIWIYFYMVLLGFMNYPSGLESISPLVIDNAKLYANPTIWSLLFTIVFAAIAVTLFILTFIYAVRLKRGEGDKKTYETLFTIGLKGGLIAFALFIPSLLWYLFTLKKYSNLKYTNIVGFVFGETAASKDLSWMFIIILVLILVTVGVGLKLVFVDFKDGISFENKVTYYLSLALAPIAGLIFEFVFFLNFLSQNPYFIVAPDLVSELPMIVVPDSLNGAAAVLDVYALTIFAGIPLFLAFLSLLYFIFSGRATSDKHTVGKTAWDL